MDHEQAIDDDVECGKCRYNLRTLPFTARCPECAFPVLRSYITFTAGARAFVPRGAPLGASLLIRTACVILSRLLRRNVDSIQFVVRAYQHAQRRHMADRRLFTQDPEIHAADLCRALTELALEHYGNPDDAAATFRFWRLERSEDVGEIVAGLIEAGIMAPGEKDSPSDFHGVCNFLDDLRGEGPPAASPPADGT
jgi:uncharacterized repeat protein (TIGR04138 family)